MSQHKDFENWTEKEINALNDAIKRHVERLNDKYAPLWKRFVESADPKNDPELSFVIHVDADGNVFWDTPFEEAIVLDGIKAHIQLLSWDRLGQEHGGISCGVVYIDYPHCRLYVGDINEMSSDNGYYKVSYSPWGWENIKKDMVIYNHRRHKHA